MSALPKIRVLDMTRVFAGPFAAQMLGDFGAEVVKIEQPGGGDDVRRMGFRKRDENGAPVGETSSFLAMNRNKRSIALDISKPEGQALLRDMVQKADVFIENFKTGGLRKYGLDHASLSALNPKLVYCSITGFGQSGPYAALPGYDPIFQAMSGLMGITGVADGQPGAGPAIVGYSVSDINAGLYASIAILAALHHRDTISGRGQHIDLALLDSQVAAHAHVAMNHLVSGKMPVRAGTASQINTPWQAFSTADRPLMVAVGNDRQFLNLCKVLGLPEDPRFATNPQRMAARDELLPLLQGAFLTRKAQAWMDALNAVGVSSGPINDFGAVAEDPQIKHREMFRTDAAGEPFIANPVNFSETPVEYRSAPPALGEQTRAVLSDWLGTPEEDIERLTAAGIIGMSTIAMIRDSAEAVAPRGGGFARIRAQRFQTPGFDPAVWRQMGEMGWIGLLVPEDQGGSGLGMAEYCALAEEMGRGLVPEPLVQGVLSATLLAAAGDAGGLEALLSGATLPLLAWQEAPDSLAAPGTPNTPRLFLPMAAGATFFLLPIRAESGLALHAASGTPEIAETQDGGHLGNLTTWQPGPRIAENIAEALDRALDEAVLATAAELLGVMEGAFAMTLAYLRTRQQFGRPIGSFQALQHRAVDLKIQLALTRASVEAAAATLDAGAAPAQRRAVTSRAKARAAEASLLVTRAAVQMHGAIGYTDEYDVGLYLRKAMVLANRFGSAALHRRRFMAEAVEADA